MPAPNLSISVEPVQSGKATYLPLAGTTSKDKPQAMIVLRLVIKNKGTSSVKITGIAYGFPNSAVATIDMQGVSQFFEGYYDESGGATLAPGATKTWTNGRVALVPGDDTTMVDNAVLLPLPAPANIQARVTCEGYSVPAAVTLPLAPHQSPAPEGAYLFPYHATDLRVGEYYVGRSEHWANGGANGTQIFAHDLGCQGYDPTKKTWSPLLPGTSGAANTDYRIYGKPVRALADGVVDSWHDGMADNKVVGKFPDPKPSPGGGNLLRIVHGDEIVVYCHLQKSSIPAALKKKGAPVKAGQAIGRVGNTGNSSAPHTHIEATGNASSKPLRPLPFRDAYVIAQAAFTPPNPAGPWTKLDGSGLARSTVAVWPAPTAPAWYPPGWAEVTRHGVSAAGYQTVFDRATSSGYRPVWVDGYEVKGKAYFNVIFRPATSIPWAARHGMTGLEYQQEFNSFTKQGYRLSNLTSYVSGGAVRYAAIFEKRAGPAWRAYHGVDAKEHQAKFEAWTKEGYRPTNVSVTSAGTPLFAAFYEKRDVGSFVHHSGLTAPAYQKAWTDNAKAGRSLAHVAAYQHGSSMRFSALFQQKVESNAGIVGRHNLTAAAFQVEFDKNLAAGYLTEMVAGYEVAAVARFAALWRKPPATVKMSAAAARPRVSRASTARRVSRT